MLKSVRNDLIKKIIKKNSLSKKIIIKRIKKSK